MSDGNGRQDRIGGKRMRERGQKEFLCVSLHHHRIIEKVRLF